MVLVAESQRVIALRVTMHTDPLATVADPALRIVMTPEVQRDFAVPSLRRPHKPPGSSRSDGACFEGVRGGRGVSPQVVHRVFITRFPGGSGGPAGVTVPPEAFANKTPVALVTLPPVAIFPKDSCRSLMCMCKRSFCSLNTETRASSMLAPSTHNKTPRTRAAVAPTEGGAQ